MRRRRPGRPRRRLFARAALIAAGFLVTSTGVAYAYFSATSSGTYGLTSAGTLSAAELSVASTTSTSATLTWETPSNADGTSWAMKETGSTAGTGTCFAVTDPLPTCTVTGLVPSTTYQFALTYTLDSWRTTSNTVTVTTATPPATCGGVETQPVANGKTYTFTLLGGGGGQGGDTGGAGGPGATVHGSFTVPSTSTEAVTVLYQVGCKGGSGAARRVGGAGGLGYAKGGNGGSAHTAIAGGGGGGGGATDLALKVGTTTTVLAVVGGGGGGGGAKIPSSHAGQPGASTTGNGPSTAARAGQDGKTPKDSSTGGAGTGAGGGGAGTQAASGGATTGGDATATPPATAGKGGTGGFNYEHPAGTVTGVAVIVTGVGTGANGGETGSIIFIDPPAPPTAPNDGHPVPAGSPADLSTPQATALPSVTAVSPQTGPSTGGTAVIVTGAGFTPTTTVDFGRVAASSVTVTSPTRLTVVAPPHAPGVAGITVTTAAGTSALGEAGQFTYVTTTTSGRTAGGTA